MSENYLMEENSPCLLLDDNARLAVAYLEDYRLMDKSLYKQRGQSILRYLEQEMAHPKGGYFGARYLDGQGKDCQDAAEKGIFTFPNGLAIMAFTKAYQVTGEGKYLKRARKTAAFIRANLMTLNGRLKQQWREGAVSGEGRLADYAYYGLSLLELYQACFDVTWLRTAVRLGQSMMVFLEGDEESGNFQEQDAIAALFLLRLARLTGKPEWQEAFRRQLNEIKEKQLDNDALHTSVWQSLKEEMASEMTLVCVTKEEAPFEEIRKYIVKQRQPIAVLFVTAKNQKALAKLSLLIQQYELPETGTFYYISKGQEPNSQGLPQLR